MEDEVKLDRQLYFSLRKAYREAVAAGTEYFWHDNQEYFVGFAKYVLEYAEMTLNIKPGEEEDPDDEHRDEE